MYKGKVLNCRSKKSSIANIAKLDERIFEISSGKQLFADLFGEHYYLEHDGRFAYAVYSGKELIRGFQLKNNKRSVPSFKKELCEFIRLYSPSNFKDFLFILSAAPYDTRESGIKELFKRKFTKCDVVDQILLDSKGFLLWSHQLRQLLSYFWDNGWEEVENELKRYLKGYLSNADIYSKLELAIGRHDNYCWRQMGKLKFSRSYSMYDALKERLIRLRIYNPNIRRAYVLYTALIK